MATFENLWNSIFTPGPTPTLLIATNASFAALQAVLFALLLATFNLHFVVLSALCGGLWWSINWFVAELREAKAKEDNEREKESSSKPPDPIETADSETETESVGQTPAPQAVETPGKTLKPHDTDDVLTRRRSLGDSSGYISTDSEWEKVDESDEKER